MRPGSVTGSRSALMRLTAHRAVHALQFHRAIVKPLKPNISAVVIVGIGLSLGYASQLTSGINSGRHTLREVSSEPSSAEIRFGKGGNFQVGLRGFAAEYQPFDEPSVVAGHRDNHQKKKEKSKHGAERANYR